MHAVVGVWTSEAGQSEEQLRMLRERIVPNVRRSVGFVAGYWMRDPATGADHTMVVFDSEEAAREFRDSVKRNTRVQAQAGIRPALLAVVEVLAEAHP